MAVSASQNVTLVIQSREGFPVVASQGSQFDWMRRAVSWFHRAFSGDTLGAFGQAYSSASAASGATTNPSQVYIQDGAVYALQTASFSAHATAADTFTIGGTVFTAETSGATGNQWNIGASATASAANLAAAINASSDVNLGVFATSAIGVLTITALIPGAIGNLITLAKSSSQITLGGNNLAGGASNAAVSYTF